VKERKRADLHFANGDDAICILKILLPKKSRRNREPFIHVTPPSRAEASMAEADL
jgi:hypothetical protein